MWEGKGEPAFSWMSGKEKNHQEPNALKIKLKRGAVSSINRADTEQTALPEAPSGCGALSSPLPSASQQIQPYQHLLSAHQAPPQATEVHSPALSPVKSTTKSLALFVGLLLLP